MDNLRIPIDPELKNIIDKLANFVARNGPEFEEMTKGKQRDNLKFSFLFGGDYYPYYKMKVQDEFMALRGQSHFQNQSFNKMNIQMNQNAMHFPPWQQQSQQYNQFNMNANLQQQSLLNQNQFQQSPYPSYNNNMPTANNEINKELMDSQPPDFWNPGYENMVTNQSFPSQENNHQFNQNQIGHSQNLVPHNLTIDKNMMVDTSFQKDIYNSSDDQTLKKIKESEINLANQHKILTDEQQARIEKTILNAQDIKLNRLCEEFSINLKELETTIAPIIESCTKDAISNGKAWILQNNSSQKVPEIVARYLLKRVMAMDSTFDTRLHLIYLINDLMHHCMRKNVEDLKMALENVIVPIFCQAFVKANEESKEKLTKLMALWEKNKYFKEEILEFIKDTANSLSTYKANLVSEYADLIHPITRDIDGRYDVLKLKHEATVESLLAVGSGRRRSKEPTNTGPEPSSYGTPTRPPSLMSVKVASASTASGGGGGNGGAGRTGTGRGGSRRDYCGPMGDVGTPANEPDFNDFLNMNGGANASNMNPAMLASLMSNVGGGPSNQAAMNNYFNMQQQQQCWPSNTNGPNNDQQQQLMAMMMMMMANNNAMGGGSKNDMMMSGGGRMPMMDQDYDQVGFGPEIPPHSRFQMDPKDKSIIPGLPYFELPAGLIVRLVQDEDVDYKPLDPAELRLPAPDPPSEQLLASVETFYSQASHEAPRNSEGWEHLGLFEFFKAKAKYRKAYLENLKNRKVHENNSTDSGEELDDKENKKPKGSHSSRSGRASRSHSLSPGSIKKRQSSPSNKKRSFKELSPPDQKSSSRSNRRSRSRSRNRNKRGGPTNNHNRSPSPPSSRRRRSSRSKSPVTERRRNSPPSSRRQNRSSRSPSQSTPFRDNYQEPDFSTQPPSDDIFAIKDVTEQQRLDDSNKGHQLLKKMGWKGAGLGLNEQGTQDPISGGEVRDKSNQFKGVGTSGNDPYQEFRKTRCKILYNR